MPTAGSLNAGDRPTAGNCKDRAFTRLLFSSLEIARLVISNLAEIGDVDRAKL